MLKIRISGFLVQKMLQIWGPHQKVWESKLSSLMEMNTSLPNFFWEVENQPIEAFAHVNITVKSKIFDSWSPIVYHSNLLKKFEKELVAKLGSLVVSEKRKAG